VCTVISSFDPSAAGCNELDNACKGAGFYIGGSTVGKGLLFDCLTPLLLGADVSGVRVNPQAAPTCMAASGPVQVAHGFDPCSASRGGDPEVVAVCSKISRWDPRSGPCFDVDAACKSAGYYVGGSWVGKGLLFNCLTPLLLGESLPGVNVNPRAPAACMALPAPRESDSKAKGASRG
jgi:hypothetical protein